MFTLNYHSWGINNTVRIHRVNPTQLQRANIYPTVTPVDGLTRNGVGQYHVGRFYYPTSNCSRHSTDSRVVAFYVHLAHSFDDRVPRIQAASLRIR